MRWHYEPGYATEDEIQLGKLPLRLDVGLFEQPGAKLPQRAQREFPTLTERLRRFNLIQFKAPTDRLELADLDTLLAHAHLWRSQQSPLPNPDDMALFIVAPELTPGFRRAVESSNVEIERERTGVHRINGLMFSLWVLETGALAGVQEPVLTLFSPVLLEEPHRIMEELVAQGHEDMLHYVLHQIQLFRRGWEEFIMQHKDTEVMHELEESIKDSLLAMCSPEERLKGLSAEERLRGLPVEERLRGLPVEERLRGLPVEEVLKSFSPEELAQLKRLLDTQGHEPSQDRSE